MLSEVRGQSKASIRNIPKFDCAILGSACNNVVIKWVPFNIQYWTTVTRYLKKQWTLINKGHTYITRGPLKFDKNLPLLSNVGKYFFKFCGLLRIYVWTLLGIQLFIYIKTILSIPEIEKIELHVCYFCFYVTKVQYKQKQRLTMEDLTTIENWIWLKCMKS